MHRPRELIEVRGKAGEFRVGFTVDGWNHSPERHSASTP